MCVFVTSAQCLERTLSQVGLTHDCVVGTKQSAAHGECPGKEGGDECGNCTI